MLGALGAGALLFLHGDRVDYSHPGFRIIQAENFDPGDIDGRVLYLDFWASWCVPCRKSFPWMQEMVERYHSRGLRVVAVNLDQERDRMQAFVDEYGANFPIVLNPSFSLFRRHQLVGLPSAIIFDLGGGKPALVRVHQGFEENRSGELEEEIAGLL